MSAVEDVNNVETSPPDVVQAQNDVNLSVNSFSYSWTLNNFSEFLKFPSAKIRSPCFTFKGSKWNLVIYSECKCEEPQLVKVRLMRSDSKGTHHYIQHKFTLIDSKGSPMVREGSSSFAANIHASHRLPFPVDDIKRELPAVTQDNRLIIICELLVLSSVDDKGSEAKEPERKTFPPVDKKVLIVTSRALALSRAQKLEFMVILPLCAMLLLMMVLHDEIAAKDVPLSNRQINELIIDSTFKIKNIAEALNLTNVKIKSSELISLFEEKFNISKAFPHMRGYLQRATYDEDLSNRTLDVPLFNVENNTHNSLDSLG